MTFGTKQDQVARYLSRDIDDGGQVLGQEIEAGLPSRCSLEDGHVRNTASRGDGLCLARQGGTWDPFPGGR